MQYEKETIMISSLPKLLFKNSQTTKGFTCIDEVPSCLNAVEFKSKKALSPIKILIVEDTLICQKIALQMLTKPAYLTELAVTGEEALAKYQQGYDVILLDLSLPDISGIDICRRIRQELGDTTIPIIAYSTISDSLRAECFAAGFTEVLTKPCSFEQLHAVIQQLVS